MEGVTVPRFDARGAVQDTLRQRARASRVELDRSGAVFMSGGGLSSEEASLLQGTVNERELV